MSSSAPRLSTVTGARETLTSPSGPGTPESRGGASRGGASPPGKLPFFFFFLFLSFFCLVTATKTNKKKSS